MVATARPYSFSKLINSLSSTTELDTTTSWERGLGERCGKLFNQTLNRSQREQGCFIPPAAMVRDLLSTPASSGGDLIANSVLKVADAVRPLTILGGCWGARLEVAGENLTLLRFVEAAPDWIREGDTYPSLTSTVTSVDAPRYSL